VKVKPADPENNMCCDEYECRPNRNSAVGSVATQYDQTSKPVENSVPAYAIALLVIGGLVLVGLVTTIALFVRYLRA